MRSSVLACVTAVVMFSSAAGTPPPAAWAQQLIPPSREAAASEEGSWPMAGANPQRTSHNTVEIRGNLYPTWYRVVEPYVASKVHIIAANNTLFLSTAAGVVAIDSETGADKWKFPTELPVEHSPTYFVSSFGKRLYVAGLDHKIYCLNAETGAKIWEYEANASGIGAGFQTNPLVVDISGNIYIYVGNRDGYMYAVRDNGSNASLYWTFKSDGPILYSAAISIDNQTIYFASNDMRAYALKSTIQNANKAGELVWRSAKLPGDSFANWWPVVIGNKVIFSGSSNYRPDTDPGTGSYNRLLWLDRDEVNYNYPEGSLICGDSARQADGSVDASCIADYLEGKPWRRTYIVLNATTGQEVTYDFNGNGKPEYAPVLYAGTHSGNRYPPVVGADGNLYQKSNLYTGNDIMGSNIGGWKPDTRYITTPAATWINNDETQSYSSGGNMIYWVHFACAGGFVTSGVRGSAGEWSYFCYDLASKAPGYDDAYNTETEAYGTLTKSRNGIYGGSDMNAPIPYNNKLYIIRNNGLIAFSLSGSTRRLANISLSPASNTPLTSPTDAQLRSRLEAEVQKMVAAGHLRPAYLNEGLFSMKGNRYCTDYLSDYWSDPNQLFLTLSKAYPFLSGTLQSQVRTYLQNEIDQGYAPYSLAHIGWSGASREYSDMPPEVDADRANHGSSGGWSGVYGVSFPPHMLYTMWKYAQAVGYSQSQARMLFDSFKSKLPTAPADDVLGKYPMVHNALIAGNYGYLQLEKMAGYTMDITQSTRYPTYIALLAKRAANFNKDTPYSFNGNWADWHCLALSVARNFIYMTPELGNYLQQNALAKVQGAMDEYYQVAPLWFVGRTEQSSGENIFHPYYDPIALMSVKAYVYDEPREELLKYLDVPVTPIGDLFYLQNLIMILETPAGPQPTPTPPPVQTFADVPPSHSYYAEIEALYRAGYTAGCNTDPLRYCPEATMNRAESSVFVERGIHTAAYDPPTPASQVFADLTLDSWAAKWVNGLWEDQYTAGCGTDPLIYCPWQGHTRAEGCVFYLRMMNGANFEPAQPTAQTFLDVPLDTWYAKWVQAAYDAGLLGACQSSPELRFCPGDPLTRALAAHMMVQAKGLQ